VSLHFQRHTRQRQIILEELQKLDSHPTAIELYDLVRRRLPNLSLGTVYRNLDLLARSGTIHKLEWSSGEARFDGNMRRHDHLRCQGCGRLEDIEGVPLELPPVVGNDFRGYVILGHRLEFVGMCPQCRCKGSQPAPAP
jgi:Fur family transcriptional regulator, ferric uptake regulator